MRIELLLVTYLVYGSVLAALRCVIYIQSTIEFSHLYNAERNKDVTGTGSQTFSHFQAIS
jgi:hypothetical protein